MDEQYELEVILHEMEVLGSNLSDMEKLVKNYTKERLMALRKQTRIDSKVPRRALEPRKGGSR